MRGRRWIAGLVCRKQGPGEAAGGGGASGGGARSFSGLRASLALPGVRNGSSGLFSRRAGCRTARLDHPSSAYFSAVRYDVEVEATQRKKSGCQSAARGSRGEHKVATQKEKKGPPWNIRNLNRLIFTAQVDAECVAAPQGEGPFTMRRAIYRSISRDGPTPPCAQPTN